MVCAQGCRTHSSNFLASVPQQEAALSSQIAAEYLGKFQGIFVPSGYWPRVACFGDLDSH